MLCTAARMSSSALGEGFPVLAAVLITCAAHDPSPFDAQWDSTCEPSEIVGAVSKDR